MNAMPDPRAWTNQPVEDWLDMDELLALLEGNSFEIRRKSSLILGEGRKGSYRFANSTKLERIATSLGLVERWHRMLLALNYGLHFAVLARRR